SKLGAQLGSSSPLLNQIWQFPFAWPLPIPDELNAVDKDSFKKLVKESSMDASYIVTIEDEGSKIDINDLNSPSKALREVTKTQLMNIFTQKMKEDEKFGRQHANTRFDELINSIADWMSDKATSANGGDKRAAYSTLNQEAQGEYYPPNRSFRSLAELHFVPGMTDEFYDILASRVTIYGMKGINPNIASKDVLKSLDPGMTDEVIKEIVKRRDDQNEGGPFKDKKEFWDFVTLKGARLEGKTDDIPLTFDSVFNFKIRATGEFAGATREITAIVMDLNKTVSKVKDYVGQEKKETEGKGDEAVDPNDPTKKTGDAGSKDKEKQQQQTPISKGPPRIVYWNER
ncbi:MAG: general secretion pathway protein GspK, partial [Bdellovibrio sp.]|nr:general secretion pathway protein GspK [Bdellovibrio sp.]